MNTPSPTPSRDSLFDTYKNIARMLHKTLGNRCEVAVHDFQELEKSLIYIEGNITNRPIGAPITDLVVKAWRREGNAVKDIINYATYTRDGRPLKSSTSFIRSAEGKVVGALCINLETTDLLNAMAIMRELVQTSPVTTDDTPETFAQTVVETRHSLMDDALEQMGKQPAVMSREERIRLVAILDEYGAFLMKGMVEYVAERIGVSKFSVYNYLKAARVNDDSASQPPDFHSNPKKENE